MRRVYFRRKMSTVRTSNFENLSGQNIFDASSGTLALSAGTTSRAPLRFNPGPSLSSPVAGSIEYNGNTFLTTSSAVSGKAFNDDSLFYGLDADRTIVGTVAPTTFYDIFGVGITLPADGSYLFDINVGLRTGATGHQIAFGFGGTAVISKIQYTSEFLNLAVSTGSTTPSTAISAVDSTFVGNPNSVANGYISPSGMNTTTKSFRVSGLIEIGTQGTLRPQIGFSANPTGTNQVTRLSYIRLNSLGTIDGDLIAGNWS